MDDDKQSHFYCTLLQYRLKLNDYTLEGLETATNAFIILVLCTYSIKHHYPPCLVGISDVSIDDMKRPYSLFVVIEWILRSIRTSTFWSCLWWKSDICNAWKPERLPDNRPITASLGVTKSRWWNIIHTWISLKLIRGIYPAWVSSLCHCVPMHVCVYVSFSTVLYVWQTNCTDRVIWHDGGHADLQFFCF